MKKINTTTLLLLILLILELNACSTFLISKKELTRFNSQNKQRHFLVIKNIYINFNKATKDSNKKATKKDKDNLKAVFKKGDKVRILLEQEVGWLKVRAFPADKPIEQSEGKVILFIIHELLAKEELPYKVQYIKSKLKKILRELAHEEEGIKTDN